MSPQEQCNSTIHAHSNTPTEEEDFSSLFMSLESGNSSNTSNSNNNSNRGPHIPPFQHLSAASTANPSLHREGSACVIDDDSTIDNASSEPKMFSRLIQSIRNKQFQQLPPSPASSLAPRHFHVIDSLSCDHDAMTVDATRKTPFTPPRRLLKIHSSSAQHPIAAAAVNINSRKVRSRELELIMSCSNTGADKEDCSFGLPRAIQLRRRPRSQLQSQQSIRRHQEANDAVKVTFPNLS